MDYSLNPRLSPIKKKQSLYFEALNHSEELDTPTPPLVPRTSVSSSSPPRLRSLKSPFSVNGIFRGHERKPSVDSLDTTFAYESLQSQRRQSSSRFFSNSSNSSSPKSATPMRQRFGKNRLNNVENTNYVNDLYTSSSLSPTLNYGDERRRSSINSDMEQPFFEQQMISPSGSPVKKSYFFDRTLSAKPSLTSLSTLEDVTNDLSLEMTIIYKSRAENNVHDFTSFRNQTYSEFWNLTAEEGKLYKEWNSLQFEIQSLIFEVFNNLKKIRFNLDRLVNIYGEELKNMGVISAVDYDKTFEVLTELLLYLEKLLKRKLKPLFDNELFVDDTKVLKILTNWFKQLNSQYKHISASIIYLSKFSANSDFKDMLNLISKKDIENTSNRSAVAPNELFSSYFVKLFTSIELLFSRLKETYKKAQNFKNYELANNLESLMKEINNTSESTSELEKKIKFNEQLTFNSEIQYSKFQMIDIFNPKRRSIEPLQLEMKTSLGWTKALIAPFDNYIAILLVKSSLMISKKEDFVVSRDPIPIQYLIYDTLIENEYKFLFLTDVNNQQKYQFRKVNDVTVAIMDRFLKDLSSLQNEFWLSPKLNQNLSVKMLNQDCFVSKVDTSAYSLDSIPNGCKFLRDLFDSNLSLNIISINNDPDDDEDSLKPTASVILSCDYFSYKWDNNSHSEKLCILGTDSGIYMGAIDDPNSFRKVHQISNVKKILVLNNDVVLCLAHESLYRLSVEKLYTTFKFKLPICDINVFEENKRPVLDFTVGYQTSMKIEPGPYLFAWNNKIVYYTCLTQSNEWKFDWQFFKTHYNIIKLQTVYANNFAVGHVVEGSAVWNLSKLSEIRSIALNDLFIKDILRNEIPIAIFPFPNEEENISEVLVVFSNFCTRMKNVKGKYIQSTDEITWFGMKCESASFDCEEKILTTVNKQCVEIRLLHENKQRRSELIGCFVGNNITLINDLAGKTVLKASEFSHGEYRKQVVFKIRRQRNLSK
ncbi:hypothetical protein CANINC_004236 [Pichia inconspicua]|uniref:CNH domain-containing protein n=1 Tax=Pichia inconspicua TaxID=52247 RepID=A0A4T0WWN8_9ASCO|nr:hypothetical protein CANINC_004236 [[Candida] inconspicua]